MKDTTYIGAGLFLAIVVIPIIAVVGFSTSDITQEPFNVRLTNCTSSDSITSLPTICILNNSTNSTTTNSAFPRINIK